ncbi:uncharacterized protein P174DRAFT_417586 [Aspergillus novofumigatus IBT 16806]|uniref:Uncharacterized protein n=1 Tax=Aspergillus novofumigatus (strain IBT 16806) TaxID=1392255 RepID=A0A2I1CG12_ASPN1|nr:uncharacterized protein P174DRAFT_417586 [Aspergillus novofumigatus IBT 16806]PKX96562.1 hypothetical protein P174DRAFT_417586 [Aspergillus novofumigatus IBT 16806]
MVFKAFITFLAMVVRPTFGTWTVTQHLIVRNITTGILPDYIVESTVYPTASVSPISTSTNVRVEYLVATQNGFGRAVINVTTSYLMLPTEPTNLPILTVPPTTTARPSIKTNYYIPVTVSNPQTCTLTDFTYTDTIGISVPSSLVPRATESDLALLVTTYESTISTNLGGQPVTTSICDVYFKSDAVPVADDDIGVNNGGFLSECDLLGVLDLTLPQLGAIRPQQRRLTITLGQRRQGEQEAGEAKWGA